jgi:oligopeptide/dipeptide ABC transporter ATP-binding protein
MSGLTAAYQTEDARIPAVRNVSFELYPGETLALVGESGSGKTSIALALLGLLPSNARVEQGSVEFDGAPVPFEDEPALRAIRGAEIAMIFQDPQAALTPTLRIGDQVAEVFTAHGVDKREAQQLAIQALGRFLPEPEDVARSFSHQLSGGMAQRVMIAMATALEPRVIIADEPTASLDAAVRDTTLSFLEELRDDRGVAVLLITHDFGIVARLADRVAVVYAGEVVEAADVRTIFRAPQHPYTYGLLSSLPSISRERRRLQPMRGQPPDLSDLPEECPFLERCLKATVRCRTEPAPRLEEVEPGHLVACFNPMAAPLRE